jgi:hypothetical protein
MLRRTTDVSCSMRAAMPGSLALYVDRIAKLRSRIAEDSSAQSQSMLEETMRVSRTHDPLPHMKFSEGCGWLSE